MTEAQFRAAIVATLSGVGVLVGSAVGSQVPQASWRSVGYGALVGGVVGAAWGAWDTRPLTAAGGA